MSLLVGVGRERADKVRPHTFDRCQVGQLELVTCGCDAVIICRQSSLVKRGIIKLCAGALSHEKHSSKPATLGKLTNLLTQPPFSKVAFVERPQSTAQDAWNHSSS